MSATHSRIVFRFLRSALFISLTMLFGAAALVAQTTSEGYVSTDDGTRLFYRKVGNGPQTVIIPGDLLLYPDFTRLANGRTLIFYDMRGRGRSDAISDEQRPKIVSIHDDVKDVERIHRHFKIEKFSLIGYS